MPTAQATGQQSETKPESGITRIPSRADLADPRDPELVQCEEDLSRATMWRIARSEAAKRLPVIRRAAKDAGEVRRLAAMAGLAGDAETEATLKLALSELAEAATSF